MVSSGLCDYYHFKSKVKVLLEDVQADTNGAYGEFTCNKGQRHPGCMDGWKDWNRGAEQDVNQITADDFYDIVLGESESTMSDLRYTSFTCFINKIGVNSSPHRIKPNPF